MLWCFLLSLTFQVSGPLKRRANSSLFKNMLQWSMSAAECSPSLTQFPELKSGESTISLLKLMKTPSSPPFPFPLASIKFSTPFVFPAFCSLIFLASKQPGKGGNLCESFPGRIRTITIFFVLRFIRTSSASNEIN